MDEESSMNTILTEADMPPLKELLTVYDYGSHKEETKPKEMDPKQPQEPKADSKADVKADEEPNADTNGDGKSESESEIDEIETDLMEDDSNMQLDPSSVIMVGKDYQASIPEGFYRYDDALADANEDKLLWDPHPLPEAQTEEYLWRITVGDSNVTSLPKGCQLPDDEEALFLLLQCGHNVEEALRIRRITSVPVQKMSIWSEEECRNFENWLASYGKGFRDPTE